MDSNWDQTGAPFSTYCTILPFDLLAPAQDQVDHQRRLPNAIGLDDFTAIIAKTLALTHLENAKTKNRDLIFPRAGFLDRIIDRKQNHETTGFSNAPPGINEATWKNRCKTHYEYSDKDVTKSFQAKLGEEQNEQDIYYTQKAGKLYRALSKRDHAAYQNAYPENSLNNQQAPMTSLEFSYIDFLRAHIKVEETGIKHLSRDETFEELERGISSSFTKHLIAELLEQCPNSECQKRLEKSRVANRKGEEKKKEKREAKKALKRASSPEEDEPRLAKKSRKSKPENVCIQRGHSQQPAAIPSPAQPTHQQYGYQPEIPQYNEYPVNAYGYVVPGQRNNVQTQHVQYSQQPEVPNPFQQMPQQLVPHDPQYDALDNGFFVEPPLEQNNAFLDPALTALDFNPIANELLGQDGQHDDSIPGNLNVDWASEPAQDPNLLNDKASSQDVNYAKPSDDLVFDENDLRAMVLAEIDRMNQAEAASSASTNNDNNKIQPEAQHFVFPNDNIPSQDENATYPLADTEAPLEEDDWASLEDEFNKCAPEIFGADPESQKQPVADAPADTNTLPEQYGATLENDCICLTAELFGEEPESPQQPVADAPADGPHEEDPVEANSNDKQDAIANAQVNPLFELGLFGSPDRTQDARKSDMVASAEEEVDFSQYLHHDVSQFDLACPNFDNTYVDLYSDN